MKSFVTKNVTSTFQGTVGRGWIPGHLLVGRYLSASNHFEQKCRPASLPTESLRVVVFGLVGLGHRQPFSLNGLVLGCKVLIFLGHGNCCVDRSRLCRMLVIVPVELVDIAAARLVLLVCIDNCKVCLLFPPTHPGGGR